MEKPSDLQLQMLDFFKVRYKSNISKYEVSQLIDKTIKKTGEEGRRAWLDHKDNIEPATVHEKEFLKFFKIPFSEDITHGKFVNIKKKIYANPENEKRFRGSDPIGTKDKEFLEFFKIDYSTGPFYNSEFLSEYEARQLKDTLLTNPQNKKLWNKHVKVLKEKAKLAVTDEQKTVLKFFSNPIPESMTTQEAETLIISLLVIPKNQERWDNYQEKSEQKELDKKKRLEDKQSFESLYEEVDDNRELYGCKKINMKRFKVILEQLTTAGFTHEQIEDDLDIFYDKTFELYPELERE